MDTKYHIPVLFEESLEALNIKADGIYVDVTFGGGGHSKGILSRLETGKLFAFDQDEDTVKNAEELLKDKSNKDKFYFIPGNFRYFRNFLRYYNIDKVDGIIADLGVSSHQFDTPERGFSYKTEGTPDMRMNKNIKLTAVSVLNTYSKESLMNIFRTYGEIDKPYKLVDKILSKRIEKPIESTKDLQEIIIQVAPKGKDYKYSSKVYQALRIEVNGEIDALKGFLKQTPGILNQAGRLVVISYHSLEDRPVKNFIRTGNFEGEQVKDIYGVLQTPFIQINRKVIVPGDDETDINSRATAAKLRIAEKI